MKKHVVIIGYVWVEPNSSAAGSRMLQLINIFLKKGYTVTFACPAQKTERSIDLKKIGVKEETIVLNSSSFDLFIKEESPTIVMFDRFMMEEQFGWRVTENCPDALKVLDTEDLHSLRKVRHDSFKKKKEFKLSQLLSSDLAKREIAAILRCDVSLIISEYEVQLLRDFFKINKKLYIHLPFLLNRIEESHRKEWPAYDERNHFVFIGNFLHAPNVNAVVQLKKFIWPLIRKKLPKAELHIYGAYAPEHILQMTNNKEGFIVKGAAVCALETIAKARVMLAPLMFGAGIKGKLTDAMLAGTPSVTTEIGSEGMKGDLSWNGFIENDIADFAKKATMLYTNEELWKEKQEKGIDIINLKYNKEKLESEFNKEIENRLLNLNNDREDNFIGSILNYKIVQATKFMSKWIEEKNR
ncbi:glycosyltransferase family 4 protein [Tenacibaculum xiamenense]|uniref:glycosyltransferase family 4 protein n=1 Tax=Tenacibaculum xiamenense TaxID=1261553 RepID=UPI003893E257